MGTLHAKMTVLGLRTVAVVASFIPVAAYAGETAQFLNAPAAAAAPAVKLAAEYELTLRLPEGRGLARLLLDSGVDKNDAAAAARLAAGHMGDKAGGCDVQVFISKAADGGGAKLVRATLMTAAGQTVIERRGADLAIASETATSKSPRLV
jgi:hypothetical protein